MLKSNLFLVKLGVVTSSLVILSPISQASEVNFAKLRELVVEKFGEDVQPDDFKKLTKSIFRKLDHNGNGISSAEIAYTQKTNEASGRARILSKILSHDLNADGTVTKEEVTKIWNFDNRGRLPKNKTSKRRFKARFAKYLDDIFSSDPNKDNTIEPSEYRSLVWGELPKSRDHKLIGIGSVLVGLDPNTEDDLQKEEVSKLLQDTFSGHTFQLSSYDQKKYGKEPEAKCKVPLPSKEAQVILLGGSSSESLSNTTIAGQDEETVTAKLNIEEGVGKIYLAITAYQEIIWEVTGATYRIERMVVSGTQDHKNEKRIFAGVVGLEQNKVDFISRKDCLKDFSKTNDTDAARVKLQSEKLFGRVPDSILAQRNIFKLSLPSGINFAADPNVDGVKGIPLASEINLYYPGGVVDINPEQVVSTDPAQKYEVLPSIAGLSQLVAEKKIIKKGRDTYTIVKPIRYPASLAGAHSVKFILKANVPEPVGDPSHSCVFSEATGKFNKSRCN